MKGFLLLYNQNMDKIKKYALTKLPLKEEYIVKQSEEMYLESDPCIIYQTAIINRYGLRLFSFIEENKLSEKIYEVNKLNDLLENRLDLPEDTAFGKFM